MLSKLNFMAEYPVTRLGIKSRLRKPWHLSNWHHKATIVDQTSFENLCPTPLRHTQGAYTRELRNVIVESGPITHGKTLQIITYRAWTVDENRAEENAEDWVGC